MNKLISEETLLGMEEREIKREFEMLSERMSRHARLLKEAEDRFSKRWFEVKEKYLLDPHGGVAMAAAKKLKKSLGDDPLICLTTAHPAKFPEIIEQISKNKTLPKEATHPSIEDAKKRCQKGYTCDYTHLYESLINAMETNWELHHKNIQ